MNIFCFLKTTSSWQTSAAVEASTRSHHWPSTYRRGSTKRPSDCSPTATMATRWTSGSRLSVLRSPQSISVISRWQLVVSNSQHFRNTRAGSTRLVLKARNAHGVWLSSEEVCWNITIDSSCVDECLVLIMWMITYNQNDIRLCWNYKACLLQRSQITLDRNSGGVIKKKLIINCLNTPKDTAIMHQKVEILVNFLIKIIYKY